MTRAATGPCSDKDTFVVAAPPSSSLASPVPSARQAAWDSTGRYRPAQPTSVSNDPGICSGGTKQIPNHSPCQT
ncbi:hypothetical protein H920_16101 [Fukomys damarensis]|uniref:Uncharacterized protein n=1 Tax=Fukomys damarensis TaxID=885580 RepID=A0A091CX98_FUKDA|nr:hypothetical protein H920_16101 [Fukomys damarensis]